MAISEHPPTGTILICDFNAGFKEPEMVKRRPVVVVSPKIAARSKLCTVVALSTTDPNPVMPYHYKLQINPRLPPPWDKEMMWVKGDMIYAVAFHRLDLIRSSKNEMGKRIYLFNTLTNDQIKEIRQCFFAVARAFGLDKVSVKHHTLNVSGSTLPRESASKTPQGAAAQRANPSSRAASISRRGGFDSRRLHR